MNTEPGENCEVTGRQRPKWWRTTYGQDLWPFSRRHGFNGEVPGRQPVGDLVFVGRMTIDIFCFTVTLTSEV